MQLHDDILREIFLWNTNIFTANNCLTTTRSASQVCHLWRSILLNSSSIWGRLIDLDALRQETDTWRKEILSRSGQSLLWIGGSMPSNPQSRSFFFISLLGPHWGRIEHIRIEGVSDYLNNRSWCNLHRPSPNLRSCSLKWYPYKNDSRLSVESSQPLFDNSAHRLRHFSISCVYLQLDAPWLLNLHHLDLWFQRTPTEILQALQSMVHLKSLSISWREFTEGHEVSLPSQFELPNAALPNLVELRLVHSSASICNALLAHIHPADGCRLEFETYLDNTPQLEQERNELSANLSSLFQCYLRSQPRAMRQATVELGSSALTFSCGPQDFNNLMKLTDEYAVPEFKMVIKAGWGFYWPIKAILPMFSFFDFSAVKKLHFFVTDEKVFSADRNPEVLQFFLNFSSITHLELHETELYTMSELSSLAEDQYLFPRLHTIHMDISEIFSWTFYTQPSLLFLRHRRDIGLPIKAIMLPFPPRKKKLWFLDQMKGLRLHWVENGEKISYICGSIPSLL